jgi:hypothetical protein
MLKEKQMAKLEERGPELVFTVWNAADSSYFSTDDPAALLEYAKTHDGLVQLRTSGEIVATMAVGKVLQGDGRTQQECTAADLQRLKRFEKVMPPERKRVKKGKPPAPTAEEKVKVEAGLEEVWSERRQRQPQQFPIVVLDVEYVPVFETFDVEEVADHAAFGDGWVMVDGKLVCMLLGGRVLTHEQEYSGREMQEGERLVSLTVEQLDKKVEQLVRQLRKGPTERAARAIEEAHKRKRE